MILIVLLPAAALYARGLGRLPGRRGRRRRTASFAAGLLVAAGAISSPMEALSEALFSAHMIQHLLLVVVAPPLLVYGLATRTILMGLPKRWRRALGALGRRLGLARLGGRPPVAWGLHALTLWSWHLPALYLTALRNEMVHVAEHATFLGTALLLWWLVVEGPQGLGHLERSLLVFGTALQTGLLGAIILFASFVLYPAHDPRAWGLDPLQDQQLAGAIMWIPMGVVYLATIAVLLLRGFRRLEGLVDG